MSTAGQIAAPRIIRVGVGLGAVTPVRYRHGRARRRANTSAAKFFQRRIWVHAHQAEAAQPALAGFSSFDGARGRALKSQILMPCRRSQEAGLMGSGA
jgi:hypothetical protein